MLLVEVDGLPAAWVADAVARIGDIGRAHGARTVRVAADDAERALLWKGRKSAFGAIARIAPDYYLHDTVVPRTRLVEVLRQVYEIADAPRPRRDERVPRRRRQPPPAALFDAREPGVMERVHAAGRRDRRASRSPPAACCRASTASGSRSATCMPLLFAPDDLDAQARLREAFDPDGVANPTKVLPAGSRCGDLQSVPDGVWVEVRRTMACRIGTQAT